MKEVLRPLTRYLIRRILIPFENWEISFLNEPLREKANELQLEAFKALRINSGVRGLEGIDPESIFYQKRLKKIAYLIVRRGYALQPRG